jgi:hypothetical protein
MFHQVEATTCAINLGRKAEKSGMEPALFGFGTRARLLFGHQNIRAGPDRGGAFHSLGQGIVEQVNAGGRGAVSEELVAHKWFKDLVLFA